MNAEIRTQISSNLPNSNVPYLSIGGRMYSQYSLFFTISSCRTQHTYANRVWISAIFSTFRVMDSSNEFIYIGATGMTLERYCMHFFLDVSGKPPNPTCTATILWRWMIFYSGHKRDIFFHSASRLKHTQKKTDSSIHTREALYWLHLLISKSFLTFSVWQKTV